MIAFCQKQENLFSLSGFQAQCEFPVYYYKRSDGTAGVGQN